LFIEPDGDPVIVSKHQTPTRHIPAVADAQQQIDAEGLPESGTSAIGICQQQQEGLSWGRVQNGSLQQGDSRNRTVWCRPKSAS